MLYLKVKGYESESFDYRRYYFHQLGRANKYFSLATFAHTCNDPLLCWRSGRCPFRCSETMAWKMGFLLPWRGRSDDPPPVIHSRTSSSAASNTSAVYCNTVAAIGALIHCLIVSSFSSQHTSGCLSVWSFYCISSLTVKAGSSCYMYSKRISIFIIPSSSSSSVFTRDSPTP